MKIFKELYAFDYKLLFLVFWIGGMIAIQIYLKTKTPTINADKAKIPIPLKRGTLSKATGIIFGKKGKHVYFSPIIEEGHVFCCASSGAGKTSALAIPSIRSACKNPDLGTCFCIDISGDISSNCDIPNKLIFDIEDPNTTPYNIFSSIDSETIYEIKNELLEKLAYLIMPDLNTTDEAGKFFLENGRSMLCGALIAYYHQNLDFVPICQKILSMDYQSLLYDIVNIGNNDAIRYISSFNGANEKNSAGCKQCMDNYIKLYATNFHMRNALHRPNSNEPCITPNLLKNHNLFFCIPDAKTDLYGSLLGLITAQTFDYCASRPNGEIPTILFLLDEFASLRIGSSDILNAIRKYRKKNIRIMILTQSLIDLDILYDDKIRDSILNNTKYKVVLGITDPVSQKYFSDIIGQHSVPELSTTISNTNTSTSYSSRKEYIVPPEDFGKLKSDLYVICDNGSFAKYQKNFYYKYK